MQYSPEQKAFMKAYREKPSTNMCCSDDANLSETQRFEKGSLHDIVQLQRLHAKTDDVRIITKQTKIIKAFKLQLKVKSFVDSKWFFPSVILFSVLFGLFCGLLLSF